MLGKIKNMFKGPVATKADLHMLEKGENHTLLVQPEDTILSGALQAGVDFPHSCRVGSCGLCKCKITEGQVRNLKNPAFTLSEEDIAEGYILGCQAMPRTDVKVEIPVYQRKSRKKTASATAG